MAKTADILQRFNAFEVAVAERLEALEATVAKIGHNGGPPLDQEEEERKPVLISERKVAARYDVSTRTLARWDLEPGLGFPPVIYVRERRYRELLKLEKWDRANARKAAAQTKSHAGRSVSCKSITET
jgi:hypothetical protein